VQEQHWGAFAATVGSACAGSVISASDEYLTSRGRLVPVAATFTAVDIGGAEIGCLVIISEPAASVGTAKRLRRALSSAGIGVWEWTVSPEWAQEIPAVTPPSRSTDLSDFLALVDPEDVEFVTQTLRHALRTGEPWNVEHRFSLPNGERRWFREIGSASQAAPNAPIHLTGITVDVTRAHGPERAVGRDNAPTIDSAPLVHEATFPPSFLIVRQARAFVDDALQRLGRASVRDVAQLLTSELVTNAILHGQGLVRIRVAASALGVRIEVDDESTTAPVVMHGDHTHPGGRGLQIVADLAADWGATMHEGGKTVWATITTHV
jgi:anti-sigma regulatory factor (Ser/Thr protein kinase)